MSDSDDEYIDALPQEGSAVQTNGYGTRGRSESQRLFITASAFIVQPPTAWNEYEYKFHGHRLSTKGKSKRQRVRAEHCSNLGLMAPYDEEIIDPVPGLTEVLKNAYDSSIVAHGTSSGPRERQFDVRRTWDDVEEGADGSLAQTIEGLADANKRKRILKDTTPMQRGIIRHVILLVDMSNSMLETDLKPSRLHLTLNIVSSFIHQFFSQNPISQLAVIITRDGLAQRLTDLSGSPSTHLGALDKLRPKPNPQGKSGYIAEIEVKGNPSLQNSLELARGMLSAAPSHGTKETIVVYGALLTSDPGDIHTTIHALVSDRVRVSVVGLAARLAICTELVTQTHRLPSTSSPEATSDTLYGVALDEVHFRALLMGHCTPPPTMKEEQALRAPSMIPMGFPSKIDEASPSLCACHATPSKGGYLCTRCGVKLCSLPMQCPTCGLQCVQSTHLARSYHHLFPLKNFAEVNWAGARKSQRGTCYACLLPFPLPPAVDEDHASRRESGAGKKEPHRRPGGVSESGRYECSVCGEHFCIDCDVLAHEVLHNCAGCLCRPMHKHRTQAVGDKGGENMDVEDTPSK